jgi:hypothetical protein
VSRNPAVPLILAFQILLACGAPPSPARAEGSLYALIDRTVEGYGGEEALRKAAAVRETGKVTSLMRGGMAGDIVREFERPDRLRVVIRYGSDTEVRVYDGKTGWREGRVVTGPPLDAMVLQAARMALPLILLDRKGNLVDKGTSSFGGKEVRTVDLPLGNGLTLTVGLDPASGRIVRSSGTGGMGMGGKPLEFVTRYDDYRLVDGVLHPFREENYANGFVTGETTLSRVEVLPALPPGTFRP